MYIKALYINNKVYDVYSLRLCTQTETTNLDVAGGN